LALNAERVVTDTPKALALNAERVVTDTPKALANFSPGLERSDNPGVDPSNVHTNPEIVRRTTRHWPLLPHWPCSGDNSVVKLIPTLKRA
jgi:hypothetical protein